MVERKDIEEDQEEDVEENLGGQFLQVESKGPTGVFT